ncbi:MULTISPECIES: hypothetical protein [unclassified Rhizobium]|uniref:hypothetical protein n=1 Tax=unclassified Rhizobium TaxID=2613769 RepID=UPI000EAA1935|nr:MULTISPECIES: hypothetical protein [unclassified Rhizobium]AYG66775.1 hypothetical protein CCGE531_12765 [Rhizobium sp. CCGE531]AYG73155.1 hypothetical protein CCGE532_12185 [Rhizobium sp. CCGE532]
MSELLQGFLACVGAALFLGTMLIAAKSIVCRSSCLYGEDEDCGAPEGDQIHFRLAEDESAGAEKSARFAEMS